MPMYPPIHHYSFIEDVELVVAERNRLPGEDSLDSPDSLRLFFRSFNRTYDLELEPKLDLIVKGTTVLKIDGVVQDHRSWFDDVAKPYDGVVVDHETGDTVGTARILFYHINPTSPSAAVRSIFDSPFTHQHQHISHPSTQTLFDGVIKTDEGQFHIKTIDVYRRSKRDIDTEIASPYSRHPNQRHASMVMLTEDASSLSAHDPHSHGESDAGLHRRSLFRAENACGFNAVHGHNLQQHTLIKGLRFAANAEAPYRPHQHRRATTNSTTGTSGSGMCGTIPSRLFMFMGAAADCNYVKNYGGSSQALSQILSDFAQASAVYESSFNVGLALVMVNLQTSCEGSNLTWNRACDSTYTINNRLSDFSQWRGQQQDDAGLWHLMTGCTSSVSGSAVGVAWLSTTCETTSSSQPDPMSASGAMEFVSGTAVSSVVPVEWKVVAHEVGHNFGAIHDCDAQTCGTTSCCQCSPCDCGGQFLMHPTDNSITSSFSTCSINYICQSLTSGARSSCLKPPGALRTIKSNICGNGVKEANEECDCGQANSTACQNDACCNASTCKLKKGAVCDQLNDDCCQNCQLAVCRPSIGICDYPESCTGVNATCPDDLHHPNGETCASGLACASGVCTSRAQQCSADFSQLNSTIDTNGVCPGHDADCSLLCATKAGDCLQMAGSFVDGTPCGYAGMCMAGSCQESGWFGVAVDWFKSNPQLGIPIVDPTAYNGKNF
ncbi:hypothetical protein HK101_010202 [Irineochytrium annulatum]|nr:hypothetical protein HK101_010202 [Irineochytrium annulatum]